MKQFIIRLQSGTRFEVEGAFMQRCEKTGQIFIYKNKPKYLEIDSLEACENLLVIVPPTGCVESS